MTRALPLIMTALMAVSITFADTWSYPAEIVTDTHEFGRSKIELRVDGTQSRVYPPHTLLINLDNELVAKYQNVGFKTLYSSTDNQYFVGLSNGGIPGTAFVVFDAKGNLLRELKHNHMQLDMHTLRTVTLVRHWFDDENPAVEFELGTHGLRSVWVNGSNGQLYDLLSANLNFKPEQKRKDVP
jgi:hypothetical protein